MTAVRIDPNHITEALQTARPMRPQTLSRAPPMGPLGFGLRVAGELIHLLLVVALVVIVINFGQWPSRHGPKDFTFAGVWRESDIPVAFLDLSPEP